MTTNDRTPHTAFSEYELTKLSYELGRYGATSDDKVDAVSRFLEKHTRELHAENDKLYELVGRSFALLSLIGVTLTDYDRARIHELQNELYEAMNKRMVK